MTLGMVGQTTVLQVLRGTKVKVQNHMKSHQGGDKIVVRCHEAAWN